MFSTTQAIWASNCFVLLFFVCIYKYIFPTCVCAHVYTCVYTHIYIGSYTHIFSRLSSGFFSFPFFLFRDCFLSIYMYSSCMSGCAHAYICMYTYVWTHTHTHTHTRIYIYIYIIKLVSVVESDPKTPFLLATKPRSRGGCYSFTRIAPLNSLYVPYDVEC